MAKRVFLSKFLASLAMAPINEIGTSETYVKKFRLYGMRTTFKFTQPPAGVEEMDWLRRGFTQIVDKMKSATDESDQFGFTL